MEERALAKNACVALSKKYQQKKSVMNELMQQQPLPKHSAIAEYIHENMRLR